MAKAEQVAYEGTATCTRDLKEAAAGMEYEYHLVEPDRINRPMFARIFIDGEPMDITLIELRDHFRDDQYDAQFKNFKSHFA